MTKTLTCRYADIHKMNVSDGPGIGVSLYLQGCPFHCPNCFNESTWDFDGGKLYTTEVMYQIADLVKQPYISRLSILGGEPLLERNYRALCNTIDVCKMNNKRLKVWLWTGRLWEDVQKEAERDSNELPCLLRKLDYLVDGPFIQEQKDLTLKFRGSSNQRIIALNGNEEIGY